MAAHQIHIAAAVIARPDGRVVVVRKRGSTVFMQPGGKIEPGEEVLAALARELEEEIGLADPAATPAYMGRFEAPAANEPNATVVAEVYLIHTNLELSAQAEIEELRWIDPSDTGDVPLAILTGELILPAYGLMLLAART